MAEWTHRAERIRDDDPYHAWAYDTRAPVDAAVATFVCPVIVELEGKTYGQLSKSLKALEKALGGRNPVFKASRAERAHIARSLAWLGNQDPAQVAPDADYARLFLLYSAESALFPRADSSLWDLSYAYIVYVGHAIRDIVEPNAKKSVSIEPLQTRAANKSAVLAIIDDSMAFLNDAFVAHSPAGPASLFQALWLQDRVGIVGNNVQNGVYLDGDDIDALLPQLATQSEAEIYAQPIVSNGVTFKPLDDTSLDHQPLAYAVSHGTHVASTALRSFVETGDLEKLALFGVTLPSYVTQDSSGSSLGSHLLAGLRQVMLWADDTGGPDSYPPLVINCSYGFSAGPKDGSSALNQVIEKMVDSRNAIGRSTSLVVPMGNAFDDRGTMERVLGPNESVAFDWVVQPDDRTSSFLEVFASYVQRTGTPDIAITLEPPSRNLPILQLAPSDLVAGTDWTLVHDTDLLATLSTWAPEPQSSWGCRHVIALAPTFSFTDAVVPAGRWRVDVKNTSQSDVMLRGFVQRDDAPGTYPIVGRQSYLDDEYASEWSEEKAAYVGLGDESCVTNTWTANVLASNVSDHVYAIGAVMGAYGDIEGEPFDASPYASAGPRGNGKISPDAIALADRSRGFPGIYRAGTYSGTDQLMNGSSVASPRFAGALAASQARNPRE